MHGAGTKASYSMRVSDADGVSLRAAAAPIRPAQDACFPFTLSTPDEGGMVQAALSDGYGRRSGIGQIPATARLSYTSI